MADAETPIPTDRPFPTDRMVRVVPDRGEAEVAVAAEIAALVRSRAAAGEETVLGLATGGSMVGLYAELVRLHREEGFDFGSVRAFNLDEFLGVAPDHPASFGAFMRTHLFDPVGLGPERARVPDGRVQGAEAERACRAWEESIRAAGGIDLQLLGLGRNGHVGFNEPGSDSDSRTRVVDLHEWTRRDCAPAFGGFAAVPRRAITAGVATIRAARRLRMLAFGEAKSSAVRAMLRARVGPEVPATWIRDHPDLELWLDPRSAACLGER